VELTTVRIQKPDDVNVIVGMSHFIKTVEDLHEALVGTVPGIRFGVAFCEASGPCLVRSSGTDPEMVALARNNAMSVGAGHSFMVFLAPGFFPVNVLNAVKSVPEVCGVFCATANSVEIVLAASGSGRGILGVIDGESPRGIETEADATDRKAFLRMIGYKL
jgi:uncharacterized protein